MRELLQQALDALLDANNMALMELSIDDAYLDEITALREELAKPKQEPTLFFGRAVYFADPKTGKLSKPEQEEYDKITVKFGERAKKYLEATKKSWQSEQDHGFDRTASHMAGEYVDTKQENLYTSEERVQKSDKFIHEPVAWWDGKNTNNELSFIYDGERPAFQKESYPIPLYTLSLRKEWQGLTDEQLSEIYNDLYMQYTRDDVNISDFILIANAIETKLKKKNDA